MRFARAITGVSAVIFFIGLTAIGQEEQTAHQAAPITQLERCKTSMPMIPGSSCTVTRAPLRSFSWAFAYFTA